MMAGTLAVVQVRCRNYDTIETVADADVWTGFYVDATREPWSNGYKMYSYIVDELPKALFAAFDELDGSRMSIMGHSMGGHGALTIVRRHHFAGRWIFW
jgi:S-formylglutathione hydrolase FrmB